MNELQRIINSISTGNIDELAKIATEALSGFSPIFAVITALACLFLAFYSYKIFKFCLFVGGAAGGYFAGSLFLAPLLESYINIEYLGVICGVICAVVCGALALTIYKLAIFAGGALGGFTVSSPFVAMILENFSDRISSIGISTNTAVIAVSVIIGLIVGFIVLKLFKPVFIIFTSISCSISAALAIIIGFAGIEQTILLGAAVIVGFIIGIFAMIKQFKSNSDNNKKPKNDKGSVRK